MLHRREVLLAGAAALGGLAHAGPAAADPEVDAEFRRAVERLGGRSRRTRAFLLQRFNPDRLTSEGRILHEALLPGAEADAALSEFRWGQSGAPYPVTQRNGAYRRAAEMRADDRPGVQVREVTADTSRLEAHAARGVIAPGFVIDATIPAVEAAAQRVRASGEQRYEALANALDNQATALRGLRARAGEEAGVWRLPDGDRYYALALQLQLGAAADPRAAHAKALARCAALQSEADGLLRREGLRSGDVAERLRALLRDERHLFPDSAEGRTQAISYMNERLARVRPLLAGVIDGADAPAEARALPEAQQANGAAGRRQGGAYLVDLGGIRTRPNWTLTSVVHHELIPGHALQAPFEREANPPDLQRRYSGGYGEGWAIYAEQLADEVGAFSDDPRGRIGYLQWMLFRMARVVADTGMHAMRWSRAQAIDEMRALQGESIAFVSIEDDVTRMCAQPGALAAQGLAALHIAELREATRANAGRNFDLRRFHRAVLRHGPLAPPGLEQAVRVEFLGA
jgi:uncharacterized protein (DUF885 family)